MKKLVFVLSAAGLVVVAAVAGAAILTDTGGAQSAGPVPSALVLTAGAGDKASASGTRASISRGTSATPEVDYTIDLNTGVMTPLPRAIIQVGGQIGRKRGVPHDVAVRGLAR